MKKKTQSITVRITQETAIALDELARKSGSTRSLVARNLLANCRACYDFLKSEWEVQKPEMIALEGKLTEEVIETLPTEYATPKTALLLSRIMRKVAEALGETGGDETDK